MNARELLAPLAALDGRDSELQAVAGLHAADSLACLVAGAGTPEGRALAAFYEASGSQAPHDVAAAAAAIIRMTEWDDIHVPSCATPGCVAVPVALAFAKDEASFAASMGAGYSVGVALAEAVGGVLALPGTWPGLFTAPAIAAVTAATALGLSQEERSQALVMALAGSSGRHGRPSGSPSARWLVVGEAALKGMRAAFAARSGVQGDLALLSPEWLKAQSAAATEFRPLCPDAMMSVGLKPFVAARQGINAIEAFRQVLADGVDPRAIEEVRVSLPSEAVAVVSRPLNVEDRLSTVAHLGLQLGIAAFDPGRLHDVERSLPFSPDVRAFAERVTVVGGEAPADASTGSWHAKLAVRTGSGWFERRCSSTEGDPGDRNAARRLVAAKIAAIGTASHTETLEALAALDSGAARRAFEMLHRTITEATGVQPQTQRRAV